MSAPEKAWEAHARMQDNRRPEGEGQGRVVLNSNCPSAPTPPIGSAGPAALPPLPPRPSQLSVLPATRPSFGMPTSMYGGYSGYGGYSSYGSYPGSMYGSYPGGYGGYGYGSYGHQPIDNRFLQAAEESSRNAFQSVESLVRAFTSVSMMLESTYHAMYSTFRAILGVVDNFSRLREFFVQFFSAITFLKMIQRFYKRLLYWIGIIKVDPRSDQIWNSVATGSEVVTTPSTSSWPLFTFLGLLFGGPYLISRFFTPPSIEPMKWDPTKGRSFKAAYSFQATSETELGFRENEIINVAPKELQLQNDNGWLLAANTEGKTGYVPVTRLVARTPKSSKTSGNNPVVETEK